MELLGDSISEMQHLNSKDLSSIHKAQNGVIPKSV